MAYSGEKGSPVKTRLKEQGIVHVGENIPGPVSFIIQLPSLGAGFSDVVRESIEGMQPADQGVLGIIRNNGPACGGP
jgi:hypothetical protein